MTGRRVEFFPGFPKDARPGDYTRVPDGVDPRENGVWYVLDPQGKGGAILPSIHQIEEHEDGSITCSPSLVMPGGWHGFLRRGVWSGA